MGLPRSLARQASGQRFELTVLSGRCVSIGTEVCLKANPSASESGRIYFEAVRDRASESDRTWRASGAYSASSIVPSQVGMAMPGTIRSGCLI